MLFAAWSPITRRILALALVALALFVLADSVAAPVIGAFVRQGDRIEELESHYVRFAEVAAHKDGLTAEAKALDADQAWRTRLLGAPSAAEAATVLQQRIRAAADTAGVQLQSFEPINAAAAQGFSKPGVRLELQAAAEPLALFLETLRKAPELVVFENVSLRSPGGGSPHDKLQVRMELSGYWHAPEAAP